MKERSGMPYDVVAFETDEYALALTSQEEGIFHRMMRKAWINGSVPADLVQLAHLCRERPSTLQKAWMHLSKMWIPMEGNPSRLVNKKQESERAYQEKIRVQNAAAGKLSAKSRNNKVILSTDVEHSLNARPTPLPSPPLPLLIDPSSPLHPPTPKQSAYTEDFEQFWTAYPRKVGKGDAFTAWKKNGHPSVVKLIGVLDSAKRSPKWKEQNGRFIPNPATWLNQKRWDDEYSSKPPMPDKPEYQG